MPLELNADVKVTRDPDGIVRQLSHNTAIRLPQTEAFLAEGGSSSITPRTVAEQYLREAAPILGFSSQEVANFAATPEKAVAEVGVELRFKEEKTVGTGVTVAYDQTVLGLPIWDAGVSVRIDGKKLGVTGAHNAAHYGINVHRPARNAAFVPHLMHPERVAALHGIRYTPDNLIVNSTRALVYYYDPGERIDSQIESHNSKDESVGLSGHDVQDFPSLPLPPVPETIKSKSHYVVTEVLFTYSYEGWGSLNWRSFIEPDTGAVLYLRALVSCARGAVFTTDPVSATGILHSASSSINDLDAIRDKVPLFGLKDAQPVGSAQTLEGEFVKLANLDLPNTIMPSENPPYDFFYPSNSSDFAACNAYHHCDGFFRLLKGMGIDVNTYFNNTNFPVPVDPNALKGEVNAMAPGNTAGNGLGRLVFGVAKAGSTVGISADARVVIHEFGHGVLWDHVDSPNFGFAHSPGDSLAVILHDPLSKAPDRFETFPFMKESAGLSRRHDRDVAQGWGWFGSRWNTQYGGEQVLSTTLFRVYRAAGGDSSDMAEKQFASRYVSYLILKAVSLLNFTTRDPDIYVAALAEADSSTDLFEGHPGGVFSKVFRWSFEKQGLYQANPGVAVTGPGKPPDIDVYIDDGRNGEYMPYTSDLSTNSEIWNRNVADGQLQNQALKPGIVNHAYVRIRNRGMKPATGITVNGFQSRNSQPVTWPVDWKPLQQIIITLPAPLNPGASIVTGPFTWVPQNSNDNLLFSVSAPGDRSNIEIVTAGQVLTNRLVSLDNNIAQKSF